MTKRMERRLGTLVAEPMHHGRGGLLIRLGGLLSVAGGVAGMTVGRRSRAGAAVAGVAALAGSACTRFGIFQAGIDSSLDPKYTVRPQRERLAAGEEARL